MTELFAVDFLLNHQILTAPPVFSTLARNTMYEVRCKLTFLAAYIKETQKYILQGLWTLGLKSLRQTKNEFVGYIATSHKLLVHIRLTCSIKKKKQQEYSAFLASYFPVVRPP